MNHRSPIQIYTTHVSSRENGWALWRPEPSDHLHPSYKSTGMRIGDVGYVDQRGGFEYLFNITCAADDPINRGQVPHNFTQYDRAQRISSHLDMHNPGAVIGTRSFRASSGSVDLSWRGKSPGSSTSCSFQSTTREGGLLFLPDGADSHDLQNRGDFSDYAVLHAESWYAHANNVLRLDIGNDALYLITGHDKAESWALAAQSGIDSQTNLSLRLDVTAVAEGSISYSYRWEDQQPYGGRVSSNALHVKNQSVFARGFRVSVRPTSWFSSQSVEVKSPSGQFLPPPEFKYTESRSRAPSGSSTPSNRQLGSTMPAPQGVANSAGEITVTVEPTSDRLLSYNPAAVINQYLLEQNPAAHVAIIHDDDYLCLLQEGEDLPLDDSELIRRVLDRFQVVINSGGVSLSPRTRNLSHASRTQSKEINPEAAKQTELGIVESIESNTPPLPFDAPIDDVFVSFPGSKKIVVPRNKLERFIEAKIFGISATQAADCMLPDLHEDLPLSLAPFAHKNTGEKDNDRLAVLGKHVLEMAVVHALFSRPPYLTRDEIELKKTEILSDINILKWIQASNLLNRVVSKHSSTLGEPTANQLRFLLQSYLGALYLQEKGISLIQDWMDNVIAMEFPQATPNTATAAPPAYQSQTEPSLETCDPTIPTQDTAVSPSPSNDSSNSLVSVTSTRPGEIHPITVARMHELAVKHFCSLRFESSATGPTGPSHSPTWTAACLIDDVVRGKGSGRTKKIARQEASRAAHAAMKWEP